jgi:hypothetical protein
MSARFLVSFSDFLVPMVFSCLRSSARETSCRAATFGFLHVSVAAAGLIFLFTAQIEFSLACGDKSTAISCSDFSVLSLVLGDGSVFGHPCVESGCARPRTCFFVSSRGPCSGVFLEQ